MARARNIKPGFFKNEDLAECSPWARLCFAGLWTLADREGRLEDRPKRIKGELFAFDTVDVDPLLGELEKYGFIMRYEAEGIRVIQILKFDLHQHPHHKEPSSDLPSPKSPGFCGYESFKHWGETGPITESLLLNPSYPIPESVGRETHAVPDPAPEPPAVDRGAPDGAARVGPDSASPPGQKPEQPSPAGLESPPTPPPRPPDGPLPTAAAVACRAMRAAGLASVNPSSPELAALIDAGATADVLADAAARAVGLGKGFAYALGMVRGQMADAARVAAAVAGAGLVPPARASPPEPAWRAEQRQRTLQAVPGIAAKNLATPPKNFIETGAEHVVAIAVG